MPVIGHMVSADLRQPCYIHYRTLHSFFVSGKGFELLAGASLLKEDAPMLFEVFLSHARVDMGQVPSMPMFLCTWTPAL